MPIKSNLSRLFYLFLLALAVLFIGSFFVSCQHQTKFVHKNTDTANSWVKYFNRIGTEIATHDTETFTIRVTRDSCTGVMGRDSFWTRDTLYYVPYDSLVKVKSTTGKDTLVKSKMWILIPDAWVLYDYNKAVIPLGQR
jgi:hypothetical protein